MRQMVKDMLRVVVGVPSRLVGYGTLARGLALLVEACVNARSPREGLALALEAERLTASLSGIAAARYGEGVHPKFRIMRYHEFFTTRIRPGERVLDVGSGTGFLAHALAEAGATVVGVELEADKVAFARKRFVHENLQFVCADATTGLPQGPFDVAVLSNVLEHLHERPAFLASLVRAQGVSRVLIRVPDFQRDWKVPMMRELGMFWKSDATHTTEHTPEELLDEVREAGLVPFHEEHRWGEIWLEAKTDSG